MAKNKPKKSPSVNTKKIIPQHPNKAIYYGDLPPRHRQKQK